MPRKARIDYPGLNHHVMARTFADMVLFADDDDRRVFLNFLSRRVRETGALCYAWALMSTHYHLLIKTSEKPLWCLMKPLNTDYAHYYNRKYERRGPLFSDRYKSVAAQDQNYLQYLVRYIHRNPLRAGICATVSELDTYPWSGHSVIMGNESNTFQNTRAVLRRFGRNVASGRAGYRLFIDQEGEEGDGPIVEQNVRASNDGKRSRDMPSCWVIGDAEFQKSVVRKDRENRLSIARYRKEGMTLEHLAEFTAGEMGISRKLLVQRSKRTKQAAARMVLCYFARRYEFPSRLIGNFLGIQQAAVSSAARKGAEIVAKRGLPDLIM